MRIQVHLRGDDSDGGLAVVEFVMAAGEGGPPLHVHPKHGEGSTYWRGRSPSTWATSW